MSCFPVVVLSRGNQVAGLKILNRPFNSEQLCISMIKNVAIRTLFFSMLSTLVIGCSPKTIDYTGVITYQSFGIPDSTEVEISCIEKMARVIGSGDPNQRLDRIEAVSQDWTKIDEIAQNASIKLDTAQKSGFAGGALELGANSLQRAIEGQYDKVCTR